MRLAVNLPNLGDLSDPAAVVGLALAAESAGWDGVFLWDHVLGWDGCPVGDAWVQLAAIAQATSRIRIGPMVTPLPRRRPWVLARQAVGVDRLSVGRLVLGVGLGTPAEAEFGTFGEETSISVRAAKLDEALAVVTGMWSGEPFGFDGQHYRVRRATFQPTPLQRPRVPIWVAATIGAEGPLARAAKFDGVFPITEGGSTPTPEEVADVVAQVRARRGDEPFDVTVAGPPPDDMAAWEDAGVTWYQVGPRPGGEPLDELHEWIAEGPPR